MARHVRCLSGCIGIRERLQDRYETLSDFRYWVGLYNIHRRLGYRSMIAAWRDNPLIESSCVPSDLRRVKP
jgi:hypothetical protein